ncbi:hypothetical protein GCM10008961_10730 [Deinococcus knuensis]|uniref:Uncharacterized protein n=1 Tax=Deinococcus knuensis TaxID=1837380 RepID=A0ABQ2SDL0_9DEIO|nr:hypothetical protein GCM10008961_10730 [Deinococcus knuensis]
MTTKFTPQMPVISSASSNARAFRGGREVEEGLGALTARECTPAPARPGGRDWRGIPAGRTPGRHGERIEMHGKPLG